RTAPIEAAMPGDERRRAPAPHRSTRATGLACQPALTRQTAAPTLPQQKYAFECGHVVCRPGENAMSTKHFAAILLAATAVIAFHGASRADGATTLTGTVSSAEEGPMAGVTVTATPDKSASTIAVTVATDDHGRYSFPAGRLAPGAYALTIRAV